MNKFEISKQLWLQHQKFTDYINAMPEDKFMESVKGKWTAGQQLDHIRRSLKPLALGLSTLLVLLRLILKKANRPSRTYDELVEKYQLKLQTPYDIGKTFTPLQIEFSQKEKLAKKVQWYANVMCNRVEYLTEKDLDKYVVPHPLLGKITIREMMYFTIYHVQHHYKQVVNNS